jgi:hypothetical protein
MGVICAQFFCKLFILKKGWGFGGFNIEPRQGMLCLVIGLFVVRSKKVIEGANNC